MRRRELLRSATLGALVAGCDRLVILDRREGGGVLTTITDNEAFYVYQKGGLPAFVPEAHAIRVAWEGEPLAPQAAADLEDLPARDVELTLQCIGHSPTVVRIGNAVWSGLPLPEVLDILGVAPPAGAVGLRLVGMDGYDAGVPIDAPLWLAWRMNGAALPFEHGAPARLLAPGRYGMKWIKWLRTLSFEREPHVSFWTAQGWDEQAFNQPNTLVVSPLAGEQVVAGERIGFVGTAFAGADPIEQVEVSLDGGEPVPASIDYDVGAFVWVIWSWSWVATSGSHTLQVRARTDSGAVTSPDPLGTDPLSGYDGSMQIRIDVR